MKEWRLILSNKMYLIWNILHLCRVFFNSVLTSSPWRHIFQSFNIMHRFRDPIYSIRSWINCSLNSTKILIVFLLNTLQYLGRMKQYLFCLNWSPFGYGDSHRYHSMFFSIFSLKMDISIAESGSVYAEKKTFIRLKYRRDRYLNTLQNFFVIQ